MISQNSGIHKNVFTEGLNKDFNKTFTPQTQYFDAQNLTLVDQNNFLALKNIKGTINVQAITGEADTEVLGVFESKYKIGSTSDIKCLTIFTAKNSQYLKIWCYDLENDDLYELYQEIVPSDYLSDDRVIDGFLYPENGLDLIYFTDFHFEHRKLRCEIPSPYTANFLTSFDLSLKRRGALGTPSLADITTGGTLLTGSYQVAYQCLNPDTNQYTRFSLLSNPIIIVNTDSTYPLGSVGVSTNKKILVSIRPSDDELAAYTHFRLAVVQNIFPEGVENLQAYLLETVPISDYLSGSTLADIPIISNPKSSDQQIPIDEVVIDLAAIDKVKTLTVKDNRLFLGNVTYTNLQYDNGNPECGGFVTTNAFDFTTTGNETYLSRNVGYYRDEVYRFAIAYFDEFGNFSTPKPLDLTNIVDNKATSTLATSFVSLDNWDFENNLTDWSQADTGDAVWLPLTFTPGIFGPGGTVAYTESDGDVYSDLLYKDVTLVAGQRYVFSLRVGTSLSNIDDIINADLELLLLDNSNNILYTENIDPGIYGLLLDPQFMTTVEKTITVPANTARIGFRFRATSAGSALVRCYIDNISIADGFRDMKFPSRKDNNGSYSILNASNQPRVLGLRLTGIINHPTWARGFVILRSKRIPDIQWQSPLVPMMSVYGIGALDNYPTVAREQSPVTNVSYTDASPMGPSTTFMPPNYFIPKHRSIIQETISTGSGVNWQPGWQSSKNIRKKGEAVQIKTSSQTVSMVFPPSTMYTQNSKYVYNEGHKLETIDAAVLDVSARAYNTDPIVTAIGMDIKTNISGTFYALTSNQYYYDSSHGGSKANLRAKPIRMLGYTSFDNFSEGTSLNQKDIFRTENLKTGGVAWGNTSGSLAVRCGVVDLPNLTVINDDNTLVFAAGSAIASPNAYAQSFYLNNVPSSTLALNGVTNRINTVEIVNCVSGLSDDRYGRPEDFTEYIYTGANVVFTNAELPTVRSGGSLPKAVTVYGGDCVVTRHIFKLSNTVYTAVNNRKRLSLGESESDSIDRWERAYLVKSGGSNTTSTLGIPVAYENVAQYLELYLESEFNGFTVPSQMFDNSSVITSASPKLVGSVTSSKVALTYDHNFNFTKQNDQKIFVTKDILIPEVDKTKARVFFSDLKIYQGGIEGFDIIRALNYQDLDETYGGITKLATVADNLYAIQERATNYITVGERVIEQTDASQLAVRSGDVIGNIIRLDSLRGSQHLQTVINTGNSLFLLDNINKSVLSVSGQEIDIISDKGMYSEFLTLLGTKIPEKDLIGLYDPIRKEYWIAKKDGTFCYVFSSMYDKWVSNLQFADGNIQGGIYTNQKLYLVGTGSDNNQISVHEMYTGPANYLMGQYVTPSVSLVVNPDPDLGKTFDDVLLVATDRLADFDIVVARESALSDQVGTGVTLDVSSRGEGNFRAKVLRDTNGHRFRGTNATMTFNWKTGSGSNLVALSSVLTKYRKSENIF